MEDKRLFWARESYAAKKGGAYRQDILLSVKKPDCIAADPLTGVRSENVL